MKGKQKIGISLIVLVITIIVMLILATVVIISLTNNNIVEKSGTAVNNTNKKTVEESANMALGELLLEKSTTNPSLSINDNTLKQKMIEKGIPQDTLDKYDIYYDDGKAIVEEYVETKLELSAEQASGLWETAGTGTITRYIGPDVDELIIPSSIDGNAITVIGNNTPVFSDKTIKKVIIPDGITLIACYAFSSQSIERIIIPDSVTIISGGAFENCTLLTNITIPNSVIEIENSAFYGCSSLVSITLPEKLTTIGYQSFYNCTSLTNITIPNSVIEIENESFTGCTGVKEVTCSGGGGTGSAISNNITYTYPTYLRGFTSVEKLILTGSIENIMLPTINTLKTIVMKEGIKNINAQNTNITTIELPNSIVGVSFKNCTSLTSITIPNNVTSINNSAFYGCSGLVSITLPNELNTIGSMSFKNCTSLTNITIPDNVISIGSNAFSGVIGTVTVGSSAVRQLVIDSGFTGTIIGGQ